MNQPAKSGMIDRVRLHYGRIITHMELAARDADAPLSTDQIWNLIASAASPRWAEAYTNLQAAKQQVSYLHSNENRPLGGIGAALESEYTNAAHTSYQFAQSHFTIVDETLRRKKFLGILFDDIVAHHRMLEASLGLSNSILKIDVQQPPTPEPRPLSSSFSQWARKVVTILRTQTATQVKKPNI